MYGEMRPFITNTNGYEKQGSHFIVDKVFSITITDLTRFQ